MNIFYLFYILITICVYIFFNFNYFIYFFKFNNNSYGSLHYIINYVFNNNIIINNIIYGIENSFDYLDYLIIVKYFMNIDMFYYSYQIYYIIYIIYHNQYEMIDLIINN